MLGLHRQWNRRNRLEFKVGTTAAAKAADATRVGSNAAMVHTYWCHRLEHLDWHRAGIAWKAHCVQSILRGTSRHATINEREIGERLTGNVAAGEVKQAFFT